jgi:hypothetical protein
MRGLFMVCLPLSLVAKLGVAAQVADSQTALKLACAAGAEIYEGDKRQLAQQDCESKYEARDGGHEIWVVEPKQHSLGYTSYTVRKSNGDVMVALVQ